MSLYQKYRPQDFKSVHAQEDAISYLTNLVSDSKNGKSIPHAYIFSGGHGIGKTTLARIFARELGTEEVDINELDAASTSRKIDDMREMIEKVYSMPVMSKYKVYILDEAHALTKDSSNAFLKTLEEPPAHAIFILCTTDEDKIFKTIRSRCNIIKLRLPTVEDISTLLTGIVKDEKVKGVEDEALQIIASSSNRSFRDSITNFEKFIHTYEVFSADNARIMFGSNSESVYAGLVEILSKKSVSNEVNISELVKYISKVYETFSYDNFIKQIREEILKADGKETSRTFYNFDNLLYVLEKKSVYDNTTDKFSALLAIFGSMK